MWEGDKVTLSPEGDKVTLPPWWEGGIVKFRDFIVNLFLSKWDKIIFVYLINVKWLNENTKKRKMIYFPC